MTVEDEIKLSILMPCLNEARTLPICIAKAQSYLGRQRFCGEIVIADNGSTDGSREIALSLGVRVVPVPQRGYGNALRAGIEAARGKFVIMGDSDDSYDFAALDAFVEQLETGHDLVMGNRFDGGIRKGAMPPLHRYFGNPMLTTVGRLLYKSPVNDFYCGLRGFRRDAIIQLGLTSPGMEFALEMIVKSTINRLRITEVPTGLFPDGRGRPPHLRSWRDGWRSLRLFLVLSPEGLFLFPGSALALISASASFALFFMDIRVGSIIFTRHTLVMTSALTVVGIQSVVFWVVAKSIAIQKKLLLPDPVFERIRALFALEKCLLVGGSFIMAGLGAAFYALLYWYNRSFGAIESDDLIKVVCMGSFLLAVGFQLVFSSFLIYLLDQKVEQPPPMNGPNPQTIDSN